jgi:hypothetical protein
VTSRIETERALRERALGLTPGQTRIVLAYLASAATRQLDSAVEFAISISDPAGEAEAAERDRQDVDAERARAVRARAEQEASGLIGGFPAVADQREQVRQAEDPVLGLLPSADAVAGAARFRTTPFPGIEWDTLPAAARGDSVTDSLIRDLLAARDMLAARQEAARRHLALVPPPPAHLAAYRDRPHYQDDPANPAGTYTGDPPHDTNDDDTTATAAAAATTIYLSCGDTLTGDPQAWPPCTVLPCGTHGAAAVISPGDWQDMASGHGAP